jgi:hypothetical protein
MKQGLSRRRTRKPIRLLLGFVVMFFLIGGAGPFQAKAFLITSDPELPPLGGEYTSPADVFAMYFFNNMTIVLDDVCFGNFTNVERTQVGDNELEEFGATLTGHAVLMFDGSEESAPIQLTGPVKFMTLGKVGQPTGAFQMEIVSMELSGDISFPSFGYIPIMMRESPTLISPGQTAITDLGDGTFKIESFFDVFTELSVDGGQVWVSSYDSTRMEIPVTMNLADALFALKICVGIDPDPTSIQIYDVNDDGKIGIEEVIFILQDIAGLRKMS